MKKRKHNKILEEQYAQQGNNCFYCKREVNFEDITRDHFLPKSKGNNLKNNKIFCCRGCNIIKGDKDLEQFKEFIILKIKTILLNVIKNNWKINDNEINKFKKYSMMLKTVNGVIENNDLIPIFS